jgi:hypothetical protein
VARLSGAEKKRRWRAANPERAREAERRYREKHAEKIRRQGRESYHRNKDRHKAYILKVRYGLTPEAFVAILVTQGYRCAICRVPLDGDRRPDVDHDHVTLRVRGILCHPCNTGLGGFRDSPTALRAAADYLER